MLAKMEKSDNYIYLKYRLTHCLTKRRLGDYIDALADLDKLFEELIAAQAAIQTEANAGKSQK